MDHPGLPSLAIVAIVRNEAPYLLEWVAHHRVVGFSRFYVADNASDDGTTALLLGLERLGVVTSIPFPTPAGHPPQFLAYDKLLREYARADEWVALVDADEFILPLGDHRSVQDAIGPLTEQPSIGAIALNWACYGSSWRKNRTTGLVMQRFVRRAQQRFGPNQHYKTILRRAAFEQVLQNPHHLGLRPGFRYVRADGHDLRVHERLGFGLSADVLWEGLRVNHYLVKSRQEFEENKKPKGRVSVLGGTKGEKYFVGHDQNDVGDSPPDWLLSAVNAEVERLRGALVERGVEIAPEPNPLPRFEQPFENVKCHIDSLEVERGTLRVRGWAMHWSGLPPVSLALEVAGERHLFLDYEHRKRGDLVRAFPMACDYCGFELAVPAPLDLSARQVRVFAGYGSETPFGPFVASSIASR